MFTYSSRAGKRTPWWYWYFCFRTGGLSIRIWNRASQGKNPELKKFLLKVSQRKSMETNQGNQNLQYFLCPPLPKQSLPFGMKELQNFSFRDSLWFIEALPGTGPGHVFRDPQVALRWFFFGLFVCSLWVLFVYLWIVFWEKPLAVLHIYIFFTYCFS